LDLFLNIKEKKRNSFLLKLNGVKIKSRKGKKKKKKKIKKKKKKKKSSW